MKRIIPIHMAHVVSIRDESSPSCDSSQLGSTQYILSNIYQRRVPLFCPIEAPPSLPLTFVLVLVVDIVVCMGTCVVCCACYAMAASTPKNNAEPVLHSSFPVQLQVTARRMPSE